MEALNGFDKLRNEMKLGFIKLEDQFKNSQSSADGKFNELEIKLNEMHTSMLENDKRILSTLISFSNIVEKGFFAIEEALEKDIQTVRKDIESIKQRLDKANL